MNNKLRQSYMRKIHHLNHVSLLAAVAAILTTSCKHDQIEQIDFNAELNKYVGTWNDSIKSSIDPNHDWNTSITTTITVNSAYEGTLRIFMERVFGNTAASLVTQDIAKGSTVLTIAKPQNADTLYAVIYDTEGYIREMPFEAKGSTLTVDFSEQSANLPAMAKTRSITSAFNFANELNDYKNGIPEGTKNSNAYQGQADNYKVNKADSNVNLYNGNCNLYFGRGDYDIANYFYPGYNSNVYLLPGAKVKLRNMSDGCRVFVAEGATLDVSEFDFNSSSAIYNRGTIKAKRYTINNSGILFNNGTIEAGDLYVANWNSQFVNAGTANLESVNINGGSHLKNMGTMDITGTTNINSNNNSWVNDGQYTTNDWIYTDGSYDVINNCRLTVKNLMSIATGQSSKGYCDLKMDGGSSVVTKDLYIDKGFVSMGSSSLLKVTGTAYMNVTNAYYGFYGEGSSPSILQAAKIVKGDMYGGNQGNANYITYSGNIIVATDSHFAQGFNGNIPFYTLAGGAKMASSQNGANVNIPSGTCTPGYTGTSTPPSIPTMNYFYAYEDMGGEGDFDFNDVVLGASAPVNGKTTITLFAAGGTLSTKVYLGTQLICSEVHEKFEVSKETMVNTFSKNEKPAQVLGTFNIPKGQTAATLDLAISVYNGHRSVTIEPNKEYGKVPLAIMVNGNGSSGLWNWPKEQQSITIAYPQFYEWVSDKTTRIDWWR